MWIDCPYRDIRWRYPPLEDMGFHRKEDTSSHSVHFTVLDYDHLREFDSSAMTSYHQARRPNLLVVFTILVSVYSQMLVVTAKALELVPWAIVGQSKGRCITAGYSGNQLATGFWVAPLGFAMSESHGGLFRRAHRCWLAETGQIAFTLTILYCRCSHLCCVFVNYHSPHCSDPIRVFTYPTENACSQTISCLPRLHSGWCQ